MAAATTDQRPAARRDRHWVTAALVAAVTLPVAIYAGRAANATAAVGAVRAGAVLADPDPAKRALLSAPTEDQVQAALAASPLRQRTVNVAMARAAVGGVPADRWMAQVGRLGWRDTTALQNKLFVAARKSDLPTVFDTSDALLRRQELVEQVIPVLSIAEIDPRLRAALVDRLAAKPSWRAVYLTTTGHLGSETQLLARFETLRALRSRPGGLPRSEAEQNVRLLDGGGLHQQAFEIWRGLESGVTRPLDDMRFLRAGASFSAGADALPFEWQMMSGEGFSISAAVESGQGLLDIEWNGRGLPLFARQRTSGLPGAYTLNIGVTPEDASELPMLDFSMQCEGDKVMFHPVPGSPTRYATQRPVPCAFPVLEVSGNIRSAASPHHLTLRSLSLRHVAGAN